MKAVLRTGVGVLALICALTMLPGVVSRASFVLPGPVLAFPESWMQGELVLSRVTEWLTLGLYVGLALVVESTASKVLFALAAIIHAMTMATDLLYLVQAVAIATSGRFNGGDVPLVSVGWLWTLASVLFLSAVIVGFRGQRWLLWFAVGAAGVYVAYYVIVLANGGSTSDNVLAQLLWMIWMIAQLAILASIAYVLLAERHVPSGTVEQAHRADAVS